MLLLYAVGGFMLVPTLIKGPLAGKLAQQIERRVWINSVLFNPFTLRLHINDLSVSGDPRQPTAPDFFSVIPWS